MVFCFSELQDIFISFLELNVLKFGINFLLKESISYTTKHMRCSVKESRYNIVFCIMCDP